MPREAGKVRARALCVEFALGSLVRGEWRVADAELEGPEFAVGLDGSGRLAWPIPKIGFDPEGVSIERLNIRDGRAVCTDAASGSRLGARQAGVHGRVALAGGPGKGRGLLRGGRPALSLSRLGQPDRRE